MVPVEAVKQMLGICQMLVFVLVRLLACRFAFVFWSVAPVLCNQVQILHK